MTISHSITAKVGRPRNTEMHTATCQAVLKMIGDGETLTSLSLVAIAHETGISRNALYRRWNSKGELYSDVLSSMRRPLVDLTEQSARENLIEIVTSWRNSGGDSRERGMKRAIVAEAQNFPDLYQQYLTEIVTPVWSIVKLAIRRGKETGEIRNDVDEELLCGVAVSSACSGSSLDVEGLSDFASASQRVIDLVFDGVAPK